MSTQGLENRFQKPKGWLWGQFQNARGGDIRFGTSAPHEKPRAHILFVEGLSEFAEKTFELARDFNNMSCNFSVIDRYGQGKSTRWPGMEKKQHSTGVDHDIDDIVQYCRENIPADEPVVLLGHSTGGLIALLALEREPDMFKAMIGTAPLLGIKIMYTSQFEDVLARLPMPKSLKERYVPGGTDWEPRTAPDATLKPEDFSSDPARNKLHDYWQDTDAALRAGSPTMGWIKEMCKGIRRALNADFAKKIDHPVLLFSAGQDELVTVMPIRTLASNMKNIEYTHYDDGRHELLMERDEIRGDILNKVDTFLKNKL